MSVWSDLKTVALEWLPDRSRPNTLGQKGELKAEQFLKKAGMRIVERSYKNHVGEIDLIAVDLKSDPRMVVFVEVKTRKSDFKGQPVEAVDDRKQRQITNTATVFLKQNDLLESKYRFDIVGILWPEPDQEPAIEHFVNAFEATDHRQMFS